MTDPLLEKQWETFQEENPTPYKHVDETELKKQVLSKPKSQKDPS